MMKNIKVYFDFRLNSFPLSPIVEELEDDSKDIPKELINEIEKASKDFPKTKFNKLTTQDVNQLSGKEGSSKDIALFYSYIEFLNSDNNVIDIITYLYTMKEANQDDLAKALGIKYNALRVHLKKLSPIIEYNRSEYPIKLKLKIEIIPSYVEDLERLDHCNEYKEYYKKSVFKDKQEQDFEIERIRRKIYRKQN